MKRVSMAEIQVCLETNYLSSIKISTLRDFRDQRGIYFSRRVSICHMQSQLAEITGSLSKHRFQISKRHLLFQTCQHLSHAESALRKSRAVYRSTDSRYRRGICFSRRVSICHMQSQLCRNHMQFVEAPIPNIEVALAFPKVSTPVTCTLSLAEITGNLSKISCEVENK
ncbi:hypothetical protein ACFX19_000123 [Malus domestica]